MIYIPGPLGKFLDDLRRELTPGCNPRAHVSVLPPRRLAEGWEAARNQLRERMDALAPFRIAAGDVAVFPETEVVYLEIGAGAPELRRMHRELSSGALAYAEPFPYHPHITLAQDLPPGGLEEVRDLATRRWREHDGERRFLADRAILVRHAGGNRWDDLADIGLGAVPAGGL